MPGQRATAASSRFSGTTIPRTKPALVDVNKERVDFWLKKGAQPSDTVRTLIARHLTVKPAAPVAEAPGK